MRENIIELLKELAPKAAEDKLSEFADRILAVAAPSKKQRESSTMVYREEIKEDDEVFKKLPSQAKVVLLALPIGKESAIGQGDWGKRAVENGLQTRQDPSRIVSYYKKDLLAAGYIHQFAK